MINPIELSSLFHTLELIYQDPAHEPKNFIEKLHTQYATWLIYELSPVFEIFDDIDLFKVNLITFFAKNWALVQTSRLSPTALIGLPIFDFLIQAALFLNEDQPLSILMPGLATEATSIDFPPLRRMRPEDIEDILSIFHPPREELEAIKAQIAEKLPLNPDFLDTIKAKIIENLADDEHKATLVTQLEDVFHYLPYYQAPLADILATHILSDDAKTLIPLRVLTIANFDKRNPYAEDYAQITKSEWQRLNLHSKLTTELHETEIHLALLSQASPSDLLSQIQQLTRVLRVEDAHGGRGTQAKVGEAAFLALAKFGEFYNLLTESQKSKIPAPIREAINKLLDVSSDYRGNMVDRIETCAGTRKEEILKAILGQESILASICLSEDLNQKHKLALLDSQQSLIKELSSKINQHHYQQGFDKLSLNPKLLKSLKIQMKLSNTHDLNILKTLEDKDLQALLDVDDKLTENLLLLFSTLETFILFSLDFGIEKLKIILPKISEKLKSTLFIHDMDFIALIQPQIDEAKVKLLSMHFDKNASLNKDYLTEQQIEWVSHIRDWFNLTNDKIEQLEQYTQNPEFDINIFNSHGASLLMLAAYNGQIETTKALLKQPKIDVNLKNQKGQTALSLAITKNHIECVEELLKHKNIKLPTEKRKKFIPAYIQAQLGNLDSKTQKFLKKIEFYPILNQVIYLNQGEYTSFIQKLFELAKNLDKDYQQGKKHPEKDFALKCLEAVKEVDLSKHRNIGLMLLRWASIIIFPLFIYFAIKHQLGMNYPQTLMNQMTSKLKVYVSQTSHGLFNPGLNKPDLSISSENETTNTNFEGHIQHDEMPASF